MVIIPGTVGIAFFTSIWQHKLTSYWPQYVDTCEEKYNDLSKIVAPDIPMVHQVSHSLIFDKIYSNKSEH
jgi:hypothetical protein